MKFGDKLKELRKEKGLTQEELAKEISVSRSLIARYENGSATPTKENLELISRYFEVSKSTLIDKNEIIELTLEQRKIILMIERIFVFFIDFINILFLIISFIPMFKIKRYIYIESGKPPIKKFSYYSMIKITLENNNPIVIFLIILISLDIFISIMILITNKKYNKTIFKIIGYTLFVIILFLMFFTIIFSLSYSNGVLYL